MESEIGYQLAGLGMLVFVLASILWPWVTKKRRRPYQIWSAALFALAATGLFGAYNFMLPSRFNIRVDLFLLVPALMIAWLQCLLFSVVRRQSDYESLDIDEQDTTSRVG